MRLKSSRFCGLIAGVMLVSVGCTDEIPTSDDGNLIPIGAETFEVTLPFSGFARDLQGFGGFGSAATLSDRLVADDWGGDLDAHTLLRFDRLPNVLAILPPGESQTAPDSLYVPISARLVLRFDTLEFRGVPPFDIEAAQIQTSWDAASATWTLAVDTLGAEVPWPEPGGGPVRVLDVVPWQPAQTDSILLDVDSLALDALLDPDRDDEGIRVASRTPGSRMNVVGARLDVTVRPSVNPDTLIDLSTTTEETTFIYSPVPETSPEIVRVGGAPAHRTTLVLDLPETIDPGSDVCERVSCPIELDANRLSYAAVGLFTLPPPTQGLAPLESLPIEVRPVYSPEFLPRSPLGCPVRGCGAPAIQLAPELFGDGAPSAVELPLTSYLRAFLQARAAGASGIPAALAILAGGGEPVTLSPAEFYAPGSDLEPYLRLILTIAEGDLLP